MSALFGVGPGSDRAALDASARRAGVGCQASEPVMTGAPPRESVPVVCSPRPGTPVSGALTYWFEDGALTRAFLVDVTPAPTTAALRIRFDALQRWVSTAIGPPTRPLSLPPGWFGPRTLSDRQQLQQLEAGQVRLSITWLRPDASVELWLAGENGRPVLGVGMRATPRPPARPVCSADVVNEALLDLFPPATPEVRARAAERLAACRVSRAAGALRATLENDTSADVQASALHALDGLGAAPSEDELARLVREGPPPVVATAREILARPPEVKPAPAAPSAVPALAGPAAPAPETGPVGVPLPAAPPPPLAAAPLPPPPPAEAPPKPSQPMSGTPLAIASSTIAGAAFMRNLGLTGGPQLAGVTPQMLFGSAGAVIGFGTAWGLSRYGLKPTVEQAAWYTNVTAWGALAGVGLWSATDSDSPKLKYGLPAAGQALGMGLGAWSAVKWKWSLEQMVMADSLVLGAGLASAGVPLVRGVEPNITYLHAAATPVLMLGAAVASRYLEPTRRDVGLMTTSALAGGWTGALVAAGLGDADFLASRRSWGGAAIGLGVGYLGGVAGGAFSEAPPSTLGIASGGLLAGNVLGLGLHLAAQGFSHDSKPGATFTDAQVHARAFSAGLGGLLLGGAAYAYAPRLQPGPRATSLTLTGALYGAGSWWLASALSYDGHTLSDVDDARLAGGVLTGAALGGLTGLVSSRWFAPDASEQLFAAGTAALGVSAGLGLAKLTTDTKGTPDAVGVLAGAGLGLTAGALLAPRVQLRAPDLGGGAVGAATGFAVGMLLPTIGQSAWTDSRETGGGALLGVSLGAGAGVAAAHLSGASGGDVGVVAGAGALGLLGGTGFGLMLPCDASAPCTSQPVRVGALIGTVGVMGGAMAMEPRLRLSSTLGPDAAKLGLWGAAFGAADGLMLAGLLDESGVISGTSTRQAWGGILFGASVESGVGILLSRSLRLERGDAAFLAAGKVTGGMFGLGLSMLARDQTGAADTLSTLTGSLAGLAAAGIAQAYTPLDRGDFGFASVTAGFGAVVGALAPTLGGDWNGLDNREAGGGALLGLSLGTIGGAAFSHATDAGGRELGLMTLGGADGLATGLGLGLLLGDGDTSRSERVGVVAGTTAGLAIGALAWPRLRFGPGDAQLTAAATGLGAWTGFWLPALGHASADDVDGQLRAGGALAGAGLASFGASLLTPALEVDPDLIGNAIALDAIWSAAGAGAGAMLSARDDAPVWGMLGGGLGGLVLGGALHRTIELDGSHAPFISLATAQGLWLGGWIPTLRDGTTERQHLGAVSLGGFGALGLATVLSPVVRPSNDLVADAALVDALWTGAGAGAGALFSEDDDAPVWGMLGGGLSGLALGAALHDSIIVDRQSAPFLALAGGQGAWLGAWLPYAVHGGAASDRERLGALALGGFGGLGAATLVSGVVRPDEDMVANAVALDVLFSGAGAGAGALLSDDDRAPVWGMLGAGLGGFALGSALHRSIEMDEKDRPLLTLATAQGLWLGGWLPSALSPSHEVTSRQRAGALALGGFGSLGLATVASAGFELDPSRAAYGGLGSMIGAAVGGGVALVSPSLQDQRGVGLMLGGTGLGLVSGLALGPRLGSEETSRVVGAAAAGATLGLGEGLLFAWSGRAEGSQYGGAALLGGGIGATLGIAAATTLPADRTSPPAAAGFAAWGAWMGAFYGSLVNYDTHEAVVGGLIGANAGFLAGYGLLQAEIVQPRDFGWLSLFGAAGTGLGAAVAAPFSSGDSTALRAGLAIGPGVGMIAGALVLPKLRDALGTAPGAPTAMTRPRGLALAQDRESAFEPVLAYARGETTPGTAPSTIGRKLSQVGSVTDWAPMVGSMPAPAEQGPAPVLFGLTGHWR
jgi:hypothetical protein